MTSLSATDLSGVAALVISLVTTFLTVGYLVSNATEALSVVLRWRERLLLRGVKDLLDDPSFSGLARDIYNNPRFNPRGTGDAQTEAELKNLPSSVAPLVFADALIDVVGLRNTSLDEMKQAIRARHMPAPIERLALILVDHQNGDLARIREEIAEWYAVAAWELSFQYRRKTQISSFVMAFALAAFLDLEPLSGSGIVASKAAAASGVPGLPILAKIFEWLVVATSALFGAPFWYAILQKITGQKTAGTAPLPGGQVPGPPPPPAPAPNPPAQSPPAQSPPPSSPAPSPPAPAGSGAP